MWSYNGLLIARLCISVLEVEVCRVVWSYNGLLVAGLWVSVLEVELCRSCGLIMVC